MPETRTRGPGAVTSGPARPAAAARSARLGRGEAAVIRGHCRAAVFGHRRRSLSANTSWGVERSEEFAGRLAERSIAAGDPTGWFERLYAAAEAGQTAVPWDRGAPSPFLTQWAAQRALTGTSALVVGCGLGDDAQFIAELGFQTVAFDISPSAITAARRRFPDSAVHYLVANLLDPPAEWHHAFDLVVESLTLQALPDPPRRTAIARLGDLVAPAGTLIVIARAREPGQTAEGPPWALTRAEIDALTETGLEPVRIEDLNDPHYD